MRPFQMEIFLGSFDYAPIGIVIPRDFAALRSGPQFLKYPENGQDDCRCIWIVLNL